MKFSKVINQIGVIFDIFRYTATLQMIPPIRGKFQERKDATDRKYAFKPREVRRNVNLRMLERKEKLSQVMLIFAGRRKLLVGPRVTNQCDEHFRSHWDYFWQRHVSTKFKNTSLNNAKLLIETNEPITVADIYFDLYKKIQRNYTQNISLIAVTDSECGVEITISK